MSQRYLSDRQRSWLEDELTYWSDQQIITGYQSEEILNLYETQQDVSRRKRSLALFALMGIASLLFGLAVLLLIGYNWEAMPRAVKLLTIFGVLAGTHSAAFYLYRREQFQRLSQTAFFLGCLFYGAAIWLVAQVFHINAHYPDGVLWWALGVLPFALLLDTLLLHLLLVALLGLWVGLEVIGFSHLGGWFLSRWMALPNGAYLLPLLALPGIACGYRKGSSLTVALYAALLAWWAALQPLAWRLEANPIFYIGTIGALLMVIAECHRVRSPFAIGYRLMGTLVIAGALVPLSFYEFNDHAFFGSATNMFGYSFLIFLISLLTIAVFLLLKRREIEKGLFTPQRVDQLIARQWLPVGMMAVMLLLSLWVGATIPNEEAILPTIVGNAGMVGLALWLMQVGLRDDRLQPFGAGVAYFLLWTILRYADLFGDVGGMLGASLLFFLCGAALLAIAIFWRNRKGVSHA